MEDGLKPVHECHTNLMFALHGELTDAILQSLKAALVSLKDISSKESDECKTFLELWRTLERRKHIKVGDYDKLIKALKTIHFEIGETIINQHVEKIRENEHALKVQKAIEAAADTERKKLRLARQLQLISDKKMMDNLRDELEEAEMREKNIKEKKALADIVNDSVSSEILSYELYEQSFIVQDLRGKLDRKKKAQGAEKARCEKLHFSLFEHLKKFIDETPSLSRKLLKTAKSSGLIKQTGVDMEQFTFTDLWPILQSENIISEGCYHRLVFLLKKTVGEKKDLIEEISRVEDEILQPRDLERPQTKDVAYKLITETTNELQPRLQLEDFEKSGTCLGTGGFGTVYLYRSKHQIAVKEICINRPSDGLKILSEMRVMSELSQYRHPHIVQYIFSELHSDMLFLGMEYMTGGSLRQKIDKEGALREDDIKSYTRQILRGVKFIHDKYIVHRDVKPNSMLFDRNNCLKLCDFRNAKQLDYHLLTAHLHIVNLMLGNISENLDGTKLSHGATTAGMGTCQYMSPEAVKGYDDASGRRGYGIKTDIWSVGCVVLEMATGNRPWSERSNRTQMITRISNNETPPVADRVPGDVKEFIAKTFIINPQDRPSAKELLQDKFLAVEPKDWACTSASTESS